MKASWLFELNTFIDGYTWTLPWTHTYVFPFFSPSRYKKCDRIEKAKMARIVKPFKGMFLFLDIHLFFSWI